MKTTKDLDLKQYVLNQSNEIHKECTSDDILNIFNRIDSLSNFINQKLNIGMFVPAVFENGEWVVLEEPDFMDGTYDDNGLGDVDKYRYKKELKQFEQAKENILFAGFDLIEFTRYYILTNDKTAIYTSKNFKFSISQIELNKIEDLIKYEIPLTENAIKLLGL